MARTGVRDSATSQFYISHGDNSSSLDGGYAVFGKVIDGMRSLTRSRSSRSPSSRSRSVAPRFDATRMSQ